MASGLRRLLLVLGIMTALFGIGADFLLPGSSPGLNLPQLLIVGAGVALAFGAHAHKRVQVLLRTKAGWHRSALTLLVILVLTLLALELLLGLGGMSVYYASREPIIHYKDRVGILCDDAVCRVDYDRLVESCARGQRSGRICIVNRQGFADAEEFISRDDFAERGRILTLGDSFTQGFSADIGNSFVEIIEAQYPDFVVWNGAFAGTGTNHAVAVFETLAPILNPQLTVLGFVMNDFRDNLTPIDRWFITEDLQGNTVVVRNFRIDQWGNIVQLDEESIRFFISHGFHPPPNEVERVLGSLQLGTLVLRLRDQIARTIYQPDNLADGLTATREQLRRLRDITAAQTSELLVILIPAFGDLTDASEHYEAAVALMRELGLPYMTLRDILEVDDYATAADFHWNNAGHQKVGKILGDCIQVYFESGSLGDCDLVVLPE